MSLEDDLLAAIAAAPEDPTPRLVYADHRLARAPEDPHAELIVVQERLAALEASGLWRDRFGDEAERLRARGRALLPEVVLDLDVPERLLVWQRGFVETLIVTGPLPANLVKRVHHPALRVVRTLRFHGASIDPSTIAAHLGPIHRLIVPILSAREVVPRFPALTHLELVETGYEAPDHEVRDAALGYGSARRRIEHGAAAQSAAEHDLLARLVRELPPLEELTLTTVRPLAPVVTEALAAYPGRATLRRLRLRWATDREPERFAARIGSDYARVCFESIPGVEIEERIAAHASIGCAYLAFGRPREATNEFDDAYILAEGRYPGLAELHERAVHAGGIERRYPTDPDPARDGLVHRVPALLRWRQSARVVAVTPNHVGAHALDGLRLRGEFDLEAAAAAFERALLGSANAEPLAKAYALLTDDIPGALAVLNEAAPSLEANVLFASIQALQSNHAVAMALLASEPHPVARLVVALCLRMKSSHGQSRELLRELAVVRDDTTDSERWLVGYLAATLNASDPYLLRRRFHGWLANRGPHRPEPALIFDALLRLAGKAAPQVDLTMVEREVDRVRGA